MTLHDTISKAIWSTKPWLMPDKLKLRFPGRLDNSHVLPKTAQLTELNEAELEAYVDVTFKDRTLEINLATLQLSLTYEWKDRQSS